MLDFAKASRLKLRFESPAGMLSVEDLWDLPLTSNTGKASLDAIARDLNRKLKQEEDVSFVVKTPKHDEGTQLKFELAKYIIDVRLEENERAAQAKANKEKKQQILALVAQKELEALGSSSLEDLRKLADSL
jgi:hypothetical protein